MQTLPPLPSVPVHDIVSVSAFENYVSMNADMLAEIHGQVHNIKSNLSNLTSDVSNVKVAPLPQEGEQEESGKEQQNTDVLDSSTLLLLLTPVTCFQYALRLYSEFRSPVYKNKSFS